MECDYSGISVVVFDFDGTLVDSNEIKNRAYYSIFPDDPVVVDVIAEVLTDSSAKSRYEIIAEIYERLASIDSVQLTSTDALVAEYSKHVLDATKNCQPFECTEELLLGLSRHYHLYLSSLTPLEPLGEIVRYKQLSKYFREIFGYPSKKEDTLRHLLKYHSVSQNELLVVGDGESDEESASSIGCSFFKVTGNNSLKELQDKLLNS